MTKRGWIIFVILCIGLVGGLIWISGRSKLDVSGIDSSKILAGSTQSGTIGDHVYGNAKSSVVLIEYGDYECPGCGDAAPIMETVTAKYKNQIAFVFRNFPLTTAHPNALAASSVAEAAGLQGKYWEMHNKLYATQNDWANLTGDARTNYFLGLGTSLGLDTKNLESDINSDQVSQKIAFDSALGRQRGVAGTPTFYLNGKELTQYVSGNNIVDKTASGANPIWSSASAMENLVIIPALESHGIPLPK